ncbi:MAG: DnaJ domain-containing protein [Chloroflexota bacterium]|nr:DnaJ domain-containing protein [Chloroflexota bacterium]
MDLRLLPYAPERDVYLLLGISPRAEHHEIVDACRRMARTLHPDRNRSARATQEMQVVNAVRSLLTDRAARAEYDAARMRFATRKQPSQPSPVAPAERLPDRRVSTVALRRTGRAAMAALLAAFRALLPARCPRCQAVPEPDYRYCARCGLRLTPGAARPTREGERVRL